MSDRIVAGSIRASWCAVSQPNEDRNATECGGTPIAKRHGASVSSIAIAWVLSWRGVTGAIVGARTPDQVDGWIGGARVQLTPQDLDEIASAIQRTQAGSGPARPTPVSTSKQTAA